MDNASELAVSNRDIKNSVIGRQHFSYLAMLDRIPVDERARRAVLADSLGEDEVSLG
jgi:hypothetical protein